MNILLFRNFKKRVNSTLRPADSLGESRTISAKSRIDYLNPTFLITGVDMTINYVKWQGAYYYVTDKAVRLNDVMELTCSIDAPATIKEDIMTTTAHVVYSSSDYTKDIRDTRLVPTMDTGHTMISESLATFFNSDGCYVISVVSTQSNGYNGVVDMYAMTSQQLTDFMSLIQSQDFWDNLWKDYVSPMDNIVSCRWLPFSVDDISGVPNSDIYLAYRNTGKKGKRITSPIMEHQLILGPMFADGHEYTFQDLPPYSTYTMYLPFVGDVPFDAEAYFKTTGTLSAYCKIYADITTGDITYMIGKYITQEYISSYSGNCSTSIPLSNLQYNATGMVTGTVAAIGGAVAAVATGGIAGLALAGGAAASAFGTWQSTKVHTMTNGSMSSRLSAKSGLNIEITRIYLVPSELFDSEERIARIGLPCNKMRTLTGLTGYCQTSGASISTSAPDSVRTTCNAMLDSGIYLE